jgi:hypothetical protein
VKALRSPWVSGGLVTVALAFVAYQVLSGSRGRARTYEAEVPSPAAPAPAAQASAVPNAGSQQAAATKARQPSSSGGIDRKYVSLHLTNWTEGVRRDPFLLYAPPHQTAATNAPSQLAKWKLKAIWRQTGSRVAALNNAIYREGDSIEGYKIIRIEDEVIWLQNADSLDHLEFEKPQGSPTPLTKATDASVPRP